MTTTTSTKTTTKRTPAKATAAKAPAKAAEGGTQKAKRGPVVRLIRWTIDGERTKSGVAQSGVSANGEYKITGSGKEWQASYTASGGKTVVLVEKASHGACYAAAVKHAKGVTA